MHLIVTRPAPDAQAWVAAFVRQGETATALPLIDICPTRQPQAVTELGQRWPALYAVMFVSAAAVRHFFAAMPLRPPHCWPQAWATGQGTVRALLAAGWPAAAIIAPAPDAAQWDSEALWALIQPRLTSELPSHTALIKQVVIARGADAMGQLAGRDWLAQQLATAGVGVDTVSVYERHCPVWDATTRAVVKAFPADALWLFSSSEAIANLQTLCPDHDWATSRALATHSRIAQAARCAGYGVVYESRPGLAAVTASIKSLR